MAGNALVLAAAAKFGITAILPDTTRHEFRMTIRSSSSTRLYVVARQKSDRQWQCSCMGWIRHRRCKHLTSMVPALEAALAPRTVR